MERTMADLAKYLNGRLIGDGGMLIRGVNALEAAREGELSFADSPRRVAQALAAAVSAVIVGDDVQELPGKSGISVLNPKLAFVLAMDLFHPALVTERAVHPTAVLGSRSRVEDPVAVRANAVIGDDVSIGRGTLIEAGAVIGDGVTIGSDCLIGPNTVVYRQCSIGNRVRIHGGSVIGGDGFGYIFHQGRHVKVPQVGNVVIEDDVEIGCNVCIDRATMGSTLIKRGTKIDNLVQIGHNDRIGEHVVIAGQSGFSGSVTVGNYAMFGGRVGITDHVDIGEGAKIGLCSVVTKSVAPGEIVWGNPARAIANTKRQLAALSRLPETLKRFAQLITRMGRMEERVDQLEQRSGERKAA
ncbi:MAG TPA: UDP-3-O-(3-hydroxymyristoyl)glucosamine N-acyltransferase [bacterium]